jgi:hypothetical protein
MKDWWRVSWKRVGIALLVVFAVLWLVAWIGDAVVRQMAPWQTARDLGRDDPHLSLLPIALPDTRLATLDGLRIERFGFSFQVPWKVIDRQKDLKGLSVLAFKGGGSVMIMDPSLSLDTLKLVRSDAGLAQIVGQETLRSNYALTAAGMVATPGQVKWWRTAHGNARNMFLLSMKMTALHGLGPIYSLHSGELRGYQEGDPSVSPYSVRLNLFDGAGHHYEITIADADGTRTALSQAELNAVVTSFKPIPHN